MSSHGLLQLGESHLVLFLERGRLAVELPRGRQTLVALALGLAEGVLAGQQVGRNRGSVSLRFLEHATGVRARFVFASEDARGVRLRFGYDALRLQAGPAEGAHISLLLLLGMRLDGVEL